MNLMFKGSTPFYSGLNFSDPTPPGGRIQGRSRRRVERDVASLVIPGVAVLRLLCRGRGALAALLEAPCQRKLSGGVCSCADGKVRTA